MRVWPTRAGIGAVLVAAIMLAAGLMKTINLLILLGDLLLVVVALNVLLAWRATRSLRIQRETDPDLFAGRTSARLLSVNNRQTRSTTVTVRETSDVHEWTGFAPSIPPGGSLPFRAAITPARRGIHAVRTTIVSGYPFGFCSVERRVPGSESLRVFPSIGQIDAERLRRWLRRAGLGDVRSRRPAPRHSPQLADLRGVRSFRSSDSPRLIHWRTSARRNELMVREYDSPDALDLLIVLDTWLPPYASRKEINRLEATISLAATLLHTWCHGEQSPRITLVAPGREKIEGRASPGLARKFLRLLAEIEGQQQGAAETQLGSLAATRAVRLIVSSRREPGPMAKMMPGNPSRWQWLTPTEAKSWYHPPTRRESPRAD